MVTEEFMPSIHELRRLHNAFNETKQKLDEHWLKNGIKRTKEADKLVTDMVYADRALIRAIKEHLPFIIGAFE